MTVDELTRSLWWHVLSPFWVHICRLDNAREHYVPDTESWRRLLEAAEGAEGVLAQQITQLTGVPPVAEPSSANFTTAAAPRHRPRPRQGSDGRSTTRAVTGTPTPPTTPTCR
ncbi:hypothetical protein [Catellatospora methionotrophica]|uniref:hypothetical protein n=1 Tax=Catellatospora methionotrophica TaxID=121620 RepID=UPI0033CCF900